MAEEENKPKRYRRTNVDIITDMIILANFMMNSLRGMTIGLRMSSPVFNLLQIQNWAISVFSRMYISHFRTNP